MGGAENLKVKREKRGIGFEPRVGGGHNRGLDPRVGKGNLGVYSEGSASQPPAMTLDPSRTKDRILLCQLCDDCRYWYDRCEEAATRARRYETRRHDIPAIWISLMPARAEQLASRANHRFQRLITIFYARYTQAAFKFLAQASKTKETKLNQ